VPHRVRDDIPLPTAESSMSDERFHVYMIATRKGGPIYTGITNDLFRRVHEHKSHVWRGFTAKYNVDKLVWCEPYDKPRGGHSSRKTAQEMAESLEGRFDRGGKSRLA
jgi:predicted GIY-YIG superfamily endonuclease